MRKSFLKVDDELRTDKGQNEVGDLRRAKPPKKAAILNILGDDKDKKDPSEQTNEEMMLDSIGCTSNVVFLDKAKKRFLLQMPAIRGASLEKLEKPLKWV